MKKTMMAMGLAVGAIAAPVLADINVGVVASLSGPAASLGGETKKAVALIPQTVDGEKINVIVLDDATDPTSAVKNVRKLISENKVDVILGPNIVSNAIAIADVANTEKTPMVSVAPLPVSGDKRAFVFRSEPSADLMVGRIVKDMLAKGVKTVGYIGFSDSWGETLSTAFTKATAGKIKIVASELFGRADPSVQAQVLKIISARPDAVFIGGSGTPAAMPQVTLRQRGYKGNIYQSHGVPNREFIKVGGKGVEGALIPVGPVLVATQLPANHPTKAQSEAFVKNFEAKYGQGAISTFAGASWDAWKLAENGIKAALKEKAKPGTPAFRQAVRKGIEKTNKLVGVNGVYTLSPTDHAGYEADAITLITIKDGKWLLVK